MLSAVRRVSTLVRQDPTRAKWYIFWATEQARKLVVEVLKEEPAEKLGLRTPDVYKKIMDRFPDAKLPDHLIPPAGQDALDRNDPNWPHAHGVGNHPPNPGHPIRSCNYLKAVVLAEMESKGQVDKIRIVQGKETDENGNRIDTISCKKRRTFESMTTDLEGKEEFRWRLVAGAELTPFSEPTPGEMFAVREAAARKKHATELYGGKPREVAYTRTNSRDEPLPTPTARQAGNQTITAGASGYLLRTTPPHLARNRPYQRSLAGQRRHYTSAREIWPNHQAETSLGQSERSSYRKSDSRRAPGKAAPVMTEPHRSSQSSLGLFATRSTDNPMMARPAPHRPQEDELVFFHEVPKKDVSEESPPPKKYVKPTMTALLQKAVKWDPMGRLRAKKEGIYDKWVQEEREAMKAEKTAKLAKAAQKRKLKTEVTRTEVTRSASCSDELHVFLSKEPPHRALVGSQTQLTTTVDKYADAPDYARSTAPRRPGAKDMAMEDLTQWQQALKEMEANLNELKQKVQSWERDMPKGAVTVDNTTDWTGERPASPHIDSALVPATVAEKDKATTQFARSATPRASNVESTSQDLSMQELKECCLQEQVKKACRQEKIKSQSVLEEKTLADAQRLTKIKEQAIREEKARQTLEMKRRALVPPGSSSFVSTLGSRLTQIDTPLPSRHKWPFRPKTFLDTERAVLER